MHALYVTLKKINKMDLLDRFEYNLCIKVYEYIYIHSHANGFCFPAWTLNDTDVFSKSTKPKLKSSLHPYSPQTCSTCNLSYLGWWQSCSSSSSGPIFEVIINSYFFSGLTHPNQLEMLPCLSSVLIQKLRGIYIIRRLPNYNESKKWIHGC